MNIMAMTKPTVAVVGLGYVGMTVASSACAVGMKVIGYDRSSSVIDTVLNGRSHVDTVSDDTVRMMLSSGFVASSSPAILSQSEVSVIIICVQTPLRRRRPDQSALISATEAVGGALTLGTMVVLESTTQPGTTEDLVLPILERNSGLKVGDEFHLAYSPERVDPGNAVFNFSNTPKIVAGITASCTARARQFYEQLCESVILAKGTREAELTKLLENTYRSVNIALINEIAVACADLGVDIRDVIRCASTKPFGFEPFYPGPGVGGHCIPVDPGYLVDAVRRVGGSLRLVELATEINSQMPRYVAERAAEIVESNGCNVDQSTILLLGVTYKADVGDIRESPAGDIAKELTGEGATVLYHDPYIPTWTGSGRRLQRVPSLSDALKSATLSILLQKHSEYDTRVLVDARLLLDTRADSGVTSESL